MIQIGFDRRLSQIIARSDVKPWEQGDSSRGWQGKSADFRRADVAGGVEDLRHRAKPSAGAFSETAGKSTSLAPSLIPSTSSSQ